MTSWYKQNSAVKWGVPVELSELEEASLKREEEEGGGGRRKRRRQSYEKQT